MLHSPQTSHSLISVILAARFIVAIFVPYEEVLIMILDIERSSSLFENLTQVLKMLVKEFIFQVRASVGLFPKCVEALYKIKSCSFDV